MSEECGKNCPNICVELLKLDVAVIWLIAVKAALIVLSLYYRSGRNHLAVKVKSFWLDAKDCFGLSMTKTSNSRAGSVRKRCLES